MILILYLLKLIVQQTCQEIVYLLFLVKSESKIYQTMIAANPLIPKKMKNGIHTIRKMKLILLLLHERFLNFRENIGISDTSNHENKQTKINK